MKGRAAALAVVALLGACAPRAPAPERVERGLPADFPAQAYLDAAAKGEPVYRVDPARSLVVVTARRGGALARFGHDHVVAGHDIAGYVSPRAGRADLALALDLMAVDEAPLRAEAGLTTEPSASDIEGTRHNMLEKVLEADRFPYVRLKITAAGPASLSTEITLHGVTRKVDIPARIEAGEREVVAEGRFELLQSDYGIAPFSILGGALQVLDRVELRFRVLARRLD